MKSRLIALLVLLLVVVANIGAAAGNSRYYISVEAPGTGVNDVHCSPGYTGGFCGERDGSWSDPFPTSSGYVNPWTIEYDKQNYYAKKDNRGYDRGYDSGYEGSKTSCSGQCYTTYDSYKY